MEAEFAKHSLLAAAFEREAQAFEKLPVATRRKQAFPSFAPSVLPLIGRKKKGQKTPDFPPVWRSEEYVREDLKKMTAGHCAYCQSQTSAAYQGEVEHFKPKSVFPMLAYAWDNYFFSCKLCNGPKKNQWPDCGYVRPDEGKPQERFVFAENGEVTEAAGDDAAKATVKDLQLWRDDLVKARALRIKEGLNTARTVINDPLIPIDSKRRTVAALLAADLSPYSQALNQNVRAVWAAAFPGMPL